MSINKLTLQEKMNQINGDPLNKYTFQEALNKWLVDNSPHNSVTYTGYNVYTPQEALALIEGKTGLNNMTVTELLNQMISGNSNLHKFTAQEAINQLSASDFG